MYFQVCAGGGLWQQWFIFKSLEVFCCRCLTEQNTRLRTWPTSCSTLQTCTCMFNPSTQLWRKHRFGFLLSFQDWNFTPFRCCWFMTLTIISPNHTYNVFIAGCTLLVFTRVYITYYLMTTVLFLWQLSHITVHYHQFWTSRSYPNAGAYLGFSSCDNGFWLMLSHSFIVRRNLWMLQSDASARRLHCIGQNT